MVILWLSYGKLGQKFNQNQINLINSSKKVNFFYPYKQRSHRMLMEKFSEQNQTFELSACLVYFFDCLMNGLEMIN